MAASLACRTNPSRSRAPPTRLLKLPRARRLVVTTLAIYRCRAATARPRRSKRASRVFCGTDVLRACRSSGSSPVWTWSAFARRHRRDTMSVVDFHAEILDAFVPLPPRTRSRPPAPRRGPRTRRPTCSPSVVLPRSRRRVDRRRVRGERRLLLLGAGRTVDGRLVRLWLGLLGDRIDTSISALQHHAVDGRDGLVRETAAGQPGRSPPGIDSSAEATVGGAATGDFVSQASIGAPRQRRRACSRNSACPPTTPSSCRSSTTRRGHNLPKARASLGLLLQVLQNVVLLVVDRSKSRLVPVVDAGVSAIVSVCCYGAATVASARRSGAARGSPERLRGFALCLNASCPATRSASANASADCLDP